MDWKLHTLRNAKRHEMTQSHLISVEGRLRLEREIRAASSADTCPEDQPEAGPSMVQDSLPILQDLLTDMSNDKSQDIEFSGTFEDTGGLPMGEGKAQLAEALLGFLDDGSYSDNQSEWSEGQREHFAFEEEMIFGEHFGKQYGSSLPHFSADGEVDDNDENSRHSKRVRLDDLETPEASKEWFPWPDKIVWRWLTSPGIPLTRPFLGMYDRHPHAPPPLSILSTPTRHPPLASACKRNP